jgi:hypothetical protein
MRARFSSEKVVERGRTTVGDIWGRMFTDSCSWYVCDVGLIGGDCGCWDVHVDESRLRQLGDCQYMYSHSKG